MPLTKLTFKPGVNRDTTNYANEGGWYECDKVRFFSAMPQKIGGWVNAAAGSTVLGTCRQMWNWVTSYADNFLAVPTNEKVYIEVGGVFYDITPLRTTTAAGDVTFAATSGSTTLTVTDVGHNCSIGDYVSFTGAVSLGGNITASILNREYVVQTVPTADTFTITSPVAANASDTGDGGANVIGYYQISPGFPVAAEGYGWGTGTFGGYATTGNTVTITIASPAVITFTGTTVSDGDVFILSTTGALPTGLSVGVPYYAVNSSITTCNFSLTEGGSAINTSGTQSGTHTATLGEFGWGQASSTPLNLPQRDWWAENFDNDLVLNIRQDTSASGASVGGPVYYWKRDPTGGADLDPAVALATRATRLDQTTIDGVAPNSVPANVGQILLSQNDKHLLAFGATPYYLSGDPEPPYDPLLIRWASQDQPNVWNPSNTNSAGFLRVSRGSKIVRAIPTRQEIIVLTDSHVYSLQFLGTIEVFGLQELSDNISVMSPRSVISVNNVVYWMGVDKFYAYNGTVQTLNCTLREHVFANINRSQAQQVICGTNEQFNEIWWFYPSNSGSGWVDSYVVYNHLEQIWYYGTMSRTAWLDAPNRTLPVAMYTATSVVDNNLDISDSSILYNHETGLDADGEPLASYIQSSDFDIGDGEQFMLTRRIIPDINFNQSTNASPEVNLVIRARDWPGSNYWNDPSDSQRVIKSDVGVYTNQIFIRTRGRQLAFRIESSQLGVQWQLGMPRLDARPDGRR